MLDNQQPTIVRSVFSRAWGWIVAFGVIVGLAAGLIELRGFWDEGIPDPINIQCGSLEGGGRTTSSWGPRRDTFTVENPAPYAVLNSITDNASYGDERSFFDVRDSRIDESGNFCNSRQVEDGETLLFRAYVENSAADNLHEFETARGVTIRVLSSPDIASLHTVTAILESQNTKPTQIFSSVELSAGFPFRLDFVSGSGRVHTNAQPGGLQLADIWHAPQALGYRELDGQIVPGYEYSIIVVFQARVTRVVPH